jgi:hypothetical protein
MQEVGARPGLTQFPFDPGGFYRRYAYSINHLPTFAVAVAEVATH